MGRGSFCRSVVPATTLIRGCDGGSRNRGPDTPWCVSHTTATLDRWWTVTADGRYARPPRAIPTVLYADARRPRSPGHWVSFVGPKAGDDRTAERFVTSVFMSHAAFERDMIRERTMADLRTARARGPAIRISESDPAKARDLWALGTRSVAEVAAVLGCGRSTLYRMLGGGGGAELGQMSVETATIVEGCRSSGCRGRRLAYVDWWVGAMAGRRTSCPV